MAKTGVVLLGKSYNSSRIVVDLIFSCIDWIYKATDKTLLIWIMMWMQSMNHRWLKNHIAKRGKRKLKWNCGCCDLRWDTRVFFFSNARIIRLRKIKPWAKNLLIAREGWEERKKMHSRGFLLFLTFSLRL